MEDNKNFIISAYTENSLGLLNRISGIFLKNRIPIESLNISDSEIDDVIRFTIAVHTTEILIKRITALIERQIDVIKAYYHNENEAVFQESALFKIRTKTFIKNQKVRELITKYHCEIMEVSEVFVVISQRGKRSETQDLYNNLKPFGVMQFVRSNRISVSKSEMPISHFLKQQEV